MTEPTEAMKAMLARTAASQASDAARAALQAAKQFIENGVEMGFITMPEASTPDSAHDTLPLIRAALATLTAPPTSIEPVQKVHELTSGEALTQLQAMGQEFDATSGEEMRLRERLSALTFLTCVSGDGPTPYLKVHFNNLAAAHAAHDELLALKREQP